VAGFLAWFKRVVIAAYLVALHLVVVFLGVKYFYPEFHPLTPARIAQVAPPTSDTPAPTPLVAPSEFYSPTPTPDANVSVSPSAAYGSDVLMIPVKGVKRSQLQDTFANARDSGRVHDAIDIMASCGTPVLAAADGEIIKFFDSVRGGTTIYELTADKQYVLYYAHLQKRADGLAEHNTVTRGTLIAYVGDTGNAGLGNCHLHFSIAQAVDPKRWWSGSYIDPFPILKQGIESP
jgi:murein DD-endopeptidase MepM/ murein hydrolase activator NlpD